MAKIKYYYNTETCKYERVKSSVTDLILNTLGFIFIASLFGFGIFMLYMRFFDSPKEAKLRKENEELKFYYEIVNQEIEKLNNVAYSLQKRDDQVYRVIFESDPISSSVRMAGVGGTERYKEIIEKGFDKEQMVLRTMQKVDVLKKQLYIQSKSYDEILKLADNKATMMASIPAIQPIKNKGLDKLVSGFGFRIHPIYKVRRMHTGVDFMAPKGTPIYATGDGVVSLVQSNFGGYGKEIEINHGFGYVTKYAHLNEFNVKIGKKVKRGEIIGYSGNTGMSTAPHLHYEIIHNGNKVNPVHYFFNDLSPAEYQKILEIASQENQSLS
jgi:murein DD-endopeptidase MepM/ murein hydrolase activator NlpD